MADEQLPKEVDIVVLGTGLPESMVAASLSRIGKKVLHIDRNDYYGGIWATFNFDSIVKWCADSEVKYTKSEIGIPIPQFDKFVRNKVIKSYIKEKNEIEDIPEVSSNVVTEDPSHSISKNIEVLQKSEEDANVQVANALVNVDTDATAVESDEVKTDKVEDTDEKVIKSCVEDEDTTNTSTQYIPSVKRKSQPAIVSQAKVNNKSPDISVEDFEILSRKFNLDTAPKFLYSAGPLVQSILKANISHYAEFKVVDRILTCKDDTVIEVPCNRSDVFTSTFLTMIEKRMLMKFLTFCVELDFESPSDELKNVSEKPFQEFLQSRRLSENLQNFIIYSIAMVKPNTQTAKGLMETCLFLQSLNRYGKSPFIWPLFGVGELPQAFCRMSAVFGCLYCLHKPALSIEISKKIEGGGAGEEETTVKVVLDKETVECKQLIMNRSYVPLEYISIEQNPPEISMAILVTDASILPSDTEHVSFLTIPPLPGRDELVRVVELGSSSSACPSGLFVLYLTAMATDTAYNDLIEYTKLLTRIDDDTEESLNSNKPRLYWSLYFNEVVSNEDIRDLPENVFVTCMPGSSLGFAHAVSDAERIFKTICPSEEFMMAVPNAEDIVWGTDEQNSDEKSTEQEGMIGSESTKVSSTTPADSTPEGVGSDNEIKELDTPCKETNEESNREM